MCGEDFFRFPQIGCIEKLINWLLTKSNFPTIVEEKDCSSKMTMLIKIDRSHAKPLFLQVVDEIRSLVDCGALVPEQALPSTRSLAAKLGIDRSTVVRAYEELQALGYLQSRPGSYHRVQKRRKEVRFDPERKSLLSWEKISNPRARRLYAVFERYSPERPMGKKMGNDVLNISQLDLDPRLYPTEEFKRCVNHVLREYGGDSLQYGTAKGYPALREVIARRLRLHGISVSAEEILITNGAQQAIDLLTRLFTEGGRKIAVETPTYANILPLLQFNGVKIKGIPMKEDGLDLDFLENVLGKEKISFVYTIPNFQNPTGITTSHPHRERLLSICLRYGVPVVEDGFEEDMKYFGKVALPIKSIDEQNIVIYLGTFSKALFPGLRIGWVTADRECIDRLTALKRFSDLTSGNLVQVVLHEFLNRGYYDRQLKKLHKVFRRRLQAALEAMEECFPSSVSWTRPAGGYTIWVRMPRKLREDELHEVMLPHRVVISPGSYYFPRQNSSEYFRVSIAAVNETEIKEGIRRAGKALREFF